MMRRKKTPPALLPDGEEALAAVRALEDSIAARRQAAEHSGQAVDRARDTAEELLAAAESEAQTVTQATLETAAAAAQHQAQQITADARSRAAHLSMVAERARPRDVSTTLRTVLGTTAGVDQ